MRHDPLADFRRMLVTVYTHEYQMTEAEATSKAAHLAKKYLSCVNIGDAHFALLNVTLKWKALCRDVVEGPLALSGDRFAGAPLIGALQWFDAMRFFHQFGAAYTPNRADVEIHLVEAATCMAFWKVEAEGGLGWPADPLEMFLPHVNGVLRAARCAPIEKPRLQEAVDRLKSVNCLSTRGGWYALSEEMKYQVPEE